MYTAILSVLSVLSASLITAVFISAFKEFEEAS
jgi:hypothetical protein